MSKNDIPSGLKQLTSNSTVYNALIEYLDSQRNRCYEEHIKAAVAALRKPEARDVALVLGAEMRTYSLLIKTLEGLKG